MRTKKTTEIRLDTVSARIDRRLAEVRALTALVEKRRAAAKR